MDTVHLPWRVWMDEEWGRMSWRERYSKILYETAYYMKIRPGNFGQPSGLGDVAIWVAAERLVQHQHSRIYQLALREFEEQRKAA